MRLEDFRFRLTDTNTGESAVMSFNDLYGYEGETCGVLVGYRDGIPEVMKGEGVSFNSGCGMFGLRPGWDIEMLEPGAANPIVETRLTEDIDERFADDPATRYIVVAFSGRRDELPVDSGRVLSLNVAGVEMRGDGYRELPPEYARLVASFLGRVTHGMPPAGRVVVLGGMHDDLVGGDAVLSVQVTIAAALIAAFGQDDMPLWDDRSRRVLPDPVSFRRLLDALGVDLSPDEFVERERWFTRSRGHVDGLRRPEPPSATGR